MSFVVQQSVSEDFLELEIGGVARRATRAEFCVWLWLVKARERAVDGKRTFIEPRARVVAEALGYCKDTVLRALKELQLAGRIRREAQHRTSRRTGRVYRRPDRLMLAGRCFSGFVGKAVRLGLDSAAKLTGWKRSDDIFVGVSSLSEKRVETTSAAPLGGPPVVSDARAAMFADMKTIRLGPNARFWERNLSQWREEHPKLRARWSGGS